MNAIRFFILLFSMIWSCSVLAQTYPDHFGTGNNVGIMATSSSASNGNTIQQTLSGTGYKVDQESAYRFLAQAGFGGDALQIDTLMKLGIEDWLDWQMTMPYETYYDRYQAIRDSIIADMMRTTFYTQDGHNITDTLINYTKHTPFTFYDKVLNDEDVFRQKAAFALSQIFVVRLNAKEEHKRKGDAYASYYDIVHRGAFGNFRDLLKDVTLSPVMGDYLSYLCNRKEDTTKNIQPDENYAREIMQLFTIGLHELNNDGSQKLDANGKLIPTYDIEDIKELAKVFTGLYGASRSEFYTRRFPGIYKFGLRNFIYDWNLPMVMEQNYHDISTKILPDGDTIPANQNGMVDIEMALDWLFNHNNVGPFIARRLIQQLVKSNPTPAYINRVATAFNNNGRGIRGDMGAVFKAIVLDPEARDCDWISHPHAGKLLQPMERNINLFKAFGVQTPSGKFRFQDYYTGVFNEGEELFVMQAFLRAPSVFNFFSPFYSEGEFVDSAGLVSPEFEILNSVSGIHYLNRTRDMIERMGRWNGRTLGNASIGGLYNNSPFMNITKYLSQGSIYLQFNNNDKPELDFRKEVCLCEGDGTNKEIEALLEHLDLILCRGQLSTQTKNTIIHTIQTQQSTNNVAAYESAFASYMVNPSNLEYTCLTQNDGFNCLRIVKEMVYLIMLSPDYTILK